MNSSMQDEKLVLQLRQYHKECFAWALHCCGGETDKASEALQNSYVKILKGHGKFKEGSAFKTWIFSIIRNSSTDLKRKESLFRKIFVSKAVYIESVPTKENPIVMDQQLNTKLIEQAMLSLSEQQRQILQLLFYHDMSLNEAAKILNITSGAIRKQYDRAKKSLVSWFSRHGIPDYK